MPRRFPPLALAVLLFLGVTALVWRGALRSSGGDPSADAAAKAHPKDASKRAEHHALLEFLPSAEFATHVAARDGAWTEGSTWKGGEVPGEGAIVLVPEDVSVTFAGAPPGHLFMVRVDGTLRVGAPGGVTTRLVVDTLFTTPSSHLFLAADGPEDGTLELELRAFDIEAFEARGAPGWSRAARELYSDGAPVRDTGAGTRATEEIEQVDDGPGVLGRYAWDPEQLSLGLIVHGQAHVAGRPKRSSAALARPAGEGATSVRLAEEATGWNPGDTVVISAAHYVGRDLVTGASLGSEDEVRRVVAIRGLEVVLDRPLAFDHTPPKAGLRVYAANLTRSLTVRSAEGLALEALSAEAVDRIASRLGHVMFMHVEDVAVLHAAFDDLGRTNKNHAADDFRKRDYDGLDANRYYHKVNGKREALRMPPDEVTNPRGRYAVHLHRAGATAEDHTARIEGSVVTGGPGWGFVSHDSRADFVDNVTFGVLGAGYVAETGNETGTWSGNLALHTYGAPYNSPHLDPRGLYRYENDEFEQTVLLEKRGSWKNHDFGHLGDGFWFQGKLIDVTDNVAVSSGLAGYFFMFRAPDQIPVDARVLVEPLSVHGPGGIHPFAPGLNVFLGNESIADRCGLVMIGQGGGRTHDERSVIADFTAWEVGELGTHAQYYPGYTIKDSTFRGSTSPSANPLLGVYFEKVQVDTVLANLTIEGFPRMYELRKSWSPGTLNQQGFPDPYDFARAALLRGEPNPLPLGYAHVLIDPGFTAEEAGEERYLGSTHRPEDVILTADQLVPGRFEVELEDDSLRVDLDNAKIPYGWLPDDPVRPTLQEGHVLLLRGTKTDSIGSIPIDYLNNVLVWHPDAVQHRLETQGYYHMPSGQLGVPLEEVFADRYTAERHVVHFIAELDARWDLTDAIDLGEFDPAAHAHVRVPAFLLAGR